MVQRKQITLGTMRLRVRSLAPSLCGVRIQCCPECGVGLQIQLESGIAVAVGIGERLQLGFLPFLHLCYHKPGNLHVPPVQP